MKPIRHKFAPLEYHLTALAIIIFTVAACAFTVHVGESDVTWVVLFPTLFGGVIIRAALDWLYCVTIILKVSLDYASAFTLKLLGEEGN